MEEKDPFKDLREKIRIELDNFIMKQFLFGGGAILFGLLVYFGLTFTHANQTIENIPARNGYKEIPLRTSFVSLLEDMKGSGFFLFLFMLIGTFLIYRGYDRRKRKEKIIAHELKKFRGF